MVSAGLMGLFGADSKKSQDSKASCSSSECLVKDQEKRFGGSQPALEKNRVSVHHCHCLCLHHHHRYHRHLTKYSKAPSLH